MKTRFALLILSLTLLFPLTADAESGKSSYSDNRAPLVHKPLMELPLGAVKAEGWLEDQLLRQASGLTGHLDELYPQVCGTRNGWLGGDGDMWERGPYWIDGLLPLAYILDDATLKAKTQPWVEWALASQKEDGFFGPDTDLPAETGLQRSNAKDWWPRMVVLKFLKQYYDATGDERVIGFFTKYFHYQYENLPKTPMNHWTYWGRERAGDNLYIVYWLYNITGDAFLLDLGELITEQTADWKDRLSNRETLNEQFSLHCVNLAQGIKQPVIRYQATKDSTYLKAIDTGLRDIRNGIGWPIGLYGADEMLHSADPTQGSELCSAVEMMFSLEKMIEITGRPDWADLLERVTFNALPTQATDEYDARQYYQQCNQIEISVKQGRNFKTSYSGTDQAFGILCGYPCCTCNMHQGWPKFTKHLWFASDDDGLAAMFYAPCKVEAKVAGGAQVSIREETNYPFEESIRFTVSTKKQVEFPMHLRIPGWCASPRILVNGQEIHPSISGGMAVIDRKWKDGDVLSLELPMKVKISRWYEASAVVEHGPLVYSLRIGEKWSKKPMDESLRAQHGEWYYEVLPTTPWNYALESRTIAANAIESSFKVIRKQTTGYPWNLENAPVEIQVPAKRLTFWHEYNGSAGPLPYSVQTKGSFPEEDVITLVPYGCTTLRITEFPVTSK